MTARNAAALSVQLFPLAAQLADDLTGTLARIKSLGCDAVEPVRRTGTPQWVQDSVRQAIGDDSHFVFRPQPDVHALRAALDDNGLTVSSCHVPLPEGDAAEAVFDEQEALGNRTLVVSAIFDPERGAMEGFHDRAAIERAAERVNVAARLARSRGMRLGYHNHFDELRTDFGGRSGLELFFELAEPDVFAEVDVYWSHVGGRNPAELIETLGPRVELIHVKDGSGIVGEPNTAVGAGVLDFPAILAAASRARFYIVEFDKADDIWAALDDSLRFLVKQTPTSPLAGPDSPTPSNDHVDSMPQRGDHHDE